MKKIILALLSTFIINYSQADEISNIKNVYNLYTKNDTNSLQNLTKDPDNSKLANYFLALNMLNKSNPAQAIAFIDTYKNSFLSNDLKHKLLTFFFNTQNWLWYANVYNQLLNSSVSQNEVCGYDLANYALNNNKKMQTNISDVIRNKIPTWCVSLIATKAANKQTTKEEEDQFVINLFKNNQITQFSEIANNLGIKTGFLNSQLSSKSTQTSYQKIYRINSIAIKDPSLALNELNASDLDKDLKKLLYNYLGYVFATKQMFNEAKDSIQKGNDKYISDTEYEWRARTYLALSDWNNVIDSINKMPKSLQNLNSWIYWKSFALNKLGRKSDALDVLNKMPKSFDYYSLLGQSALRSPLQLDKPIIANNFNNIALFDEANTGFNLYIVGKQNNSTLLTSLGTQLIYRAINNSNDEDIAAISDKAYSLNINTIAIYGGSRVKKLDPSRGYPVLFNDAYKKYSSNYQIEQTIPLAITRQESRFNPNALAFDGGVGLMQLMPNTALYISKKLNSSNCYKSYECNIQFGTWFLSHLLQKFNGNLIYASAGYNAGPGRAHKWQTAFNHLDNTVQIELIPFKITHDYVQHIMSNRLIYDSIINKSSLDMNEYLNKISNSDTGYIADDDNTDGDSTSPHKLSIENGF
ncbi:MAG: transglycosylase SLT domain-containing protein [Burkholderiales bacterium]|nr:transglycosylase SLT domain-containing protein [Burkholderiales bacterium]